MATPPPGDTSTLTTNMVAFENESPTASLPAAEKLSDMPLADVTNTKDGALGKSLVKSPKPGPITTSDGTSDLKNVNFENMSRADLIATVKFAMSHREIEKNEAANYKAQNFLLEFDLKQKDNHIEKLEKDLKKSEEKLKEAEGQLKTAGEVISNIEKDHQVFIGQTMEIAAHANSFNRKILKNIRDWKGKDMSNDTVKG